MSPSIVMSGVSLATAAVATAIAGRAFAAEVLVGMMGPLAVAVFTWELAARTYRDHPERLTGVMTAAFGGKLVFFGVYVAVALKLLALRPVPFVVSFTAYFVGLLIVEAFSLRRLFLEAAAK